MDFLDTIEDLISVLIIISLVLFIFVIPIMTISYFMERKGCIETANKLNYGYEYSFWTGCIVTDTNNNKFLLEQLRQIKED